MVLQSAVSTNRVAPRDLGGCRKMDLDGTAGRRRECEFQRLTEVRRDHSSAEDWVSHTSTCPMVAPLPALHHSSSDGGPTTQLTSEGVSALEPFCEPDY